MKILLLWFDNKTLQEKFDFIVPLRTYDFKYIDDAFIWEQFSLLVSFFYYNHWVYCDRFCDLLLFLKDYDLFLYGSYCIRLYNLFKVHKFSICYANKNSITSQKYYDLMKTLWIKIVLIDQKDLYNSIRTHLYINRN